MKSMTGFGTCSYHDEHCTVRCEIRCLNSKGLDVYIHSGMFPGEMDIQIRKMAEEILQRGKIDIFLHVHSSDILPLELNTNVLIKYYQKVMEASEILNAGKEGLLAALLRWEGVTEKKTPELSEKIKETILQCLRKSMMHAEEFRIKEGEKLYSFFLERIRSIQSCLQEIHPLVPQRLIYMKDKLQKHMSEMSVSPDANRLEQEMIYYAERLDIKEELDRFQLHLQHLQEVMKEEMPGKKMGFICMELQREINTLSNKAADAKIQKWAVLIKEEVEKLREQAMNVA